MSDTGSAEIDCALARLQAGEVVVYPTETLYGLGASLWSAAGLARMGQLKRRPRGKAVPVLVSGRQMLAGLVDRVPELAGALIDAFWPGPLTLVLPARAGLPEAVTGAARGVGVRVSSHPLAQALVCALGAPLTASSANPAGELPPRTAEDARRYFGAAVAVYVDGGRLPGGASTVVRVEDDSVEVLREGSIEIAALVSVLGPDRVVRGGHGEDMRS